MSEYFTWKPIHIENNRITGVYFPFDCPDDTIGRLTWCKKVNGLTLVELGYCMNRHPDQLQEWLNGERRPFAKSLERIERFLEESLGS